MRDDSGVNAKSFEIPKRLIWETWKRVAANQGGPTVTDRVAQTAVKLRVEPRIDAIFHSSSFGYRPNKSAHQAVTQVRKNFWRYDWVVDIDLRSFFDTIDHGLLTRAVEKHVAQPWAQRYIRRWLQSPVRKQTGEIVARDRGTAQGGVISPLLANIFFHYAFDRWVQTEYPQVPFERYADDVVCHCRTKQQAEQFLSALRERLTACGLSLHPEKTRLVYCKEDDVKRRIFTQSSTFWGSASPLGRCKTVMGNCSLDSGLR